MFLFQEKGYIGQGMYQTWQREQTHTKFLFENVKKLVQEHTGGWEDNIKMGLKYTHVVWKHVVWINLTQNRDRYDAFVNFWFLEYSSKLLLPEYQTTRRHSVIVTAVRTSNIVPNGYKIHNASFSHRTMLYIVYLPLAKETCRDVQQ